MSKFARFPDQKYINHVRDALWSGENRATVMIGSGLSKQAIPARPGVGALPVWDELATAMHNELVSPRQHNDEHCEQDRRADSESPLRIAQDYEDAFGRSGLHLFLQRQVRDGDFKPGKFHTRLLKLPWRDVFATNWDTLLERTRSQVPERAYSVVHNKDEIPLSTQPRIFKLHGSIDGHYPLVATEKDYDDYPKWQAPFVNTVQQAMMETVFCLIGFSGRDPNFLRWSSWVQENLGEVAPRIYLAGWLALCDDERIHLRENNVTSIDLACHPQSSRWPPHLRYKFALDWILRTLEYGRKYDVRQWPVVEDNKGPEPPVHLKPLEVVSSDQPMKESWSSGNNADSRSPEDSVRTALLTWAHNRRLYPGWLIAPLEVRQTLVSVTSDWESPILKVLDQLSPIDQLAALRELVWRYEITLEPISSELESAALGSLALVDCETQAVNGDFRPDISWSEVRESWREVALTLVTAARYKLDKESFCQRIEMLTPYFDDDHDVGHRINHEKSLWAAISLDFGELEIRLDGWKTQDCDPIWMVRKAALLSEAGREEESRGLIEGAVAELQRIPVDDESVAGPSREGWALWSTIDDKNRQEVFNRWSHLASRRCDAYAEQAEVASSLTASDRKSDPPDFDHGTRHSTSIGFAARRDFEFRKAYRAIRLSEIAGTPVAAPNAALGWANAADLAQRAAERLVKFEAELAARLVIRACTYDKDEALMRVLSRHSIAKMQDDGIQRLAEDCTRLIDYSLPRGWIEHIRVAIEVLSRLALRLDPDSALKTFDYAMSLYRDRQHPFASHTWISSPLQNLLSRIWKSLTRDQKKRRAIELLAAPIVGLDDFDVQFPNHHPDPGGLVSGYLDTPLPRRNADSEAQWQDVIRGLLRALRVEGAPRIRATRRLLPLAVNGILTESETTDVASALWHNDHTRVDGLPGGTELYDWAFFVLPEPKPGLAARRFIGKWLSGRRVESRLDLIRSGETTTVSVGAPPDKAIGLEDSIFNLGVAIDGLRDRGRSLGLADAERKYVVKLVSQWSNTAVCFHRDELVQREVRRWAIWVVDGLVPILSHVEIPESVGEILFEKLKNLTDFGIPAYGPIGGLVKLLPHRATDLASWLRTGMASDDHAKATSAVASLASWLQLSNVPGSSIQSPPKDVLRELGFIIGARRKAPLSEALRVGKVVFDEGSVDSQEVLRSSIAQGLDYLAEELRYDRELVDEDAPTLRLRCADLASSMAKAGLEETPAVARWLEIASKDPFAEVRNSVADSSGD